MTTSLPQVITPCKKGCPRPMDILGQRERACVDCGARYWMDRDWSLVALTPGAKVAKS